MFELINFSVISCLKAHNFVCFMHQYVLLVSSSSWPISTTTTLQTCQVTRVRHFWTLAHLFLVSPYRYWLGSHYGSPVLDQVIIRIIPEQGRHNWWGYGWGHWEHCVSWLATLYWQEINMSCEQTLLLQSAPFFQDNFIRNIKIYLICHKSDNLEA